MIDVVCVICGKWIEPDDVLKVQIVNSCNQYKHVCLCVYVCGNDCRTKFTIIIQKFCSNKFDKEAVAWMPKETVLD